MIAVRVYPNMEDQDKKSNDLTPSAAPGDKPFSAPTNRAAKKTPSAKRKPSARDTTLGELQFRALAEHSQVGVYLIRQARFIYVNPRMAGIFGYTPEQFLGLEMIDDLIAPQDRVRMREQLERRRKGDHSSAKYLFHGLHKNGNSIDLEVRTKAVLLEDEAYIVGTLLDVSERIAAETALRNSEARFRHIYDSLPVMLHTVDAGGVIRDVNRAWEKTTGYTKSEVIGRQAGFLLTDAGKRLAQEHVWPLYEAQGFVRDIEYQWRTKRGDLIDVLLDCQDTVGPDGEPIHINLVRDVTAQRKIESALDRERRLASVTLNAIGDGVIRSDEKARVQYMNSVAEKLLGMDRGTARGRKLLDVFRIGTDPDSAEAAERLATDLTLLSNGEAVSHADYHAVFSANGDQYIIEASLFPLSDPASSGIASVLVFRDITQRHRTAKKLAYQASHDALTGAYNRFAFAQRLDGLVDADSALGSASHVLLYLDLDHFKPVNDTCGHKAGDELLVKLTRLITENIRRNDTLARLGGDEFAVLLERCPLHQATRLAEKLVSAIRSYRFTWDEHEFRVGVSIGLVEFDGASHTPSQILTRADHACYAAKKQGGNQVVVENASTGTR